MKKRSFNFLVLGFSIIISIGLYPKSLHAQKVTKLFEKGEYIKAEQYCVKQKGEAQKQSFLELANCYFNKGQISKAAKYYDEADNKVGFGKLADFYFGKNDLENSAIYYEKSDKSREGLLKVSEAYFNQGNMDRAAIYYKKLWFNNNKELNGCYLKIADRYFKLNDYEKAIEYYEKAYSDNRVERDKKYRLFGEMALVNNELEKAKEYLDKTGEGAFEQLIKKVLRDSLNKINNYKSGEAFEKTADYYAKIAMYYAFINNNEKAVENWKKATEYIFRVKLEENTYKSKGKYVIDTVINNYKASLQNKGYHFYKSAVSKNGKLFVSYGYLKDVRSTHVTLWDVDSGSKLYTFNVHEPKNMMFSDNNRYLIITHDDKVDLYQIVTGEKIWSYKYEKNYNVLNGLNCSFSKNNKYIIVSGSANSILLDCESGDEINWFLGGKAALAHDNSIVAVCGFHNIEIFDIKSREQLDDISSENIQGIDFVSIAFSSDNNYIYVNNYNKGIIESQYVWTIFNPFKAKIYALNSGMSKDEVYEKLAYYYIKTNEPRRLDLVKNYVNNITDEKTVKHIYFDLGEAYFNAKIYEKAESNYLLSDRASEGLTKLALVFKERGDYKSAINLFRKANETALADSLNKIYTGIVVPDATTLKEIFENSSKTVLYDQRKEDIYKILKISEPHLTAVFFTFNKTHHPFVSNEVKLIKNIGEKTATELYKGLRGYEDILFNVTCNLKGGIEQISKDAEDSAISSELEKKIVIDKIIEIYTLLNHYYVGMAGVANAEHRKSTSAAFIDNARIVNISIEYLESYKNGGN